MTQLLTLGRVLLTGDSSAQGAPVSAQPKRLALLTYLAIASATGPVRRDLLVALFWPELGDEEARRALRQSLHYLRRTIGDTAVVGSGEDLTVDTDQLWCDAVELERLVASGRQLEALALYRGDFFSGFHVPDTSIELEEWIERTRARLRRRAADAAWHAAASAEGSGESSEAIALGRRACELEPDQEGGWRKLMLLQDRLGNRAGALHTYDELAARLRREFDADPSAETVALASRLRSERQPRLPALAEVGLPAEAPSPAVATPAIEPPALGRRRSLRPVGLTVLSVMALGLLFAWAVAYRGQAQPDRVAASALAPRDRVLVADFADGGGDTALAVAITEAFRVDLAQSPGIRVMTPRQVLTALERMERFAEVGINDSLAREVAIREGVKAIVTGRVARLGERWGLTVELLAASSGDVIASVRETAENSSDLIDAVDRASHRLRRQLGESIGDLRGDPPLAEVVTASLPALRKYTEAIRLFFVGNRLGAIPLLEEAIALDSTFASAHLVLANIYEASAEPGRAEAARLRAMAHLERLPFQDRQALRGSDAFARGDYGTAIQAYEAFVKRYPDHAPALNNLALAYRDDRQLAQAEHYWNRAIEVDSSILQLYFGLQSVQMLAGRTDDSRGTLDLIGRRSPGNTLLLTVEVQDAAARRDWETAERRAEANVAAKQSDTLDLVDAVEQMAGIVMTQGRLAEAERHWRSQQEIAAASGSWGRRLFGTMMLARTRLNASGDTAAAIALVDQGLARMPLDRMLPGDRQLGDLARFFAAVGQPGRARAYLARLGREGLDGPSRRADLEWAEGAILLAEHRPAQAEPLLRRATRQLACTICGVPDLARAREALGDIKGAIDAWETYLRTPWLFRYELDAYELGPGLVRLAHLYDLQGDAFKANEVRSHLLALWRRGDASLQPTLVEARRRMTILD